MGLHVLAAAEKKPGAMEPRRLAINAAFRASSANMTGEALLLQFHTNLESLLTKFGQSGAPRSPMQQGWRNDFGLLKTDLRNFVKVTAPKSAMLSFASHSKISSLSAQEEMQLAQDCQRRGLRTFKMTSTCKLSLLMRLQSE